MPSCAIRRAKRAGAAAEVTWCLANRVRSNQSRVASCHGAGTRGSSPMLVCGTGEETPSELAKWKPLVEARACRIVHGTVLSPTVMSTQGQGARGLRYRGCQAAAEGPGGHRRGSRDSPADIVGGRSEPDYPRVLFSPACCAIGLFLGAQREVMCGRLLRRAPVSTAASNDCRSVELLHLHQGSVVRE